ncbi:MAG TPA: hypothetical protein VEB21_10385, partial [Terriglobales bacterium]|nr:hypothetical protein [Terriglobales bacterium]
MIRKSLPIAALLVLSLSTSAPAADLGIRASSLVIVDTPDKTALTYSASRDLGIQKGAAGPAYNLDGAVEIFFSDAPGNLARLNLSQKSAWQLNDDKSAKFEDGTNIDKLLITNGRRLKVKAHALGDVPSWTMRLADADLASAANGVVAMVTIRNAIDSSVHRMCTRFSLADGSRINFRELRNGGRRLIARRGVPISCARVAHIRMEPDQSRGYFSMPWPNDIRLLADGSLDLAGYPLPVNNPTVDGIVAVGGSITKGFGTNSAVFFQTAGPLDPASLPGPEASTAADSAVMLVNLDNPAAPRTPLLMNFKENVGQLRPPDLLSLLPYPGHPLLGETRYAAILFNGLQSTGGVPLLPAPLLSELDQAWDADKPVEASEWAALQAQRADVYDYVTNHTSWSSSDVVAFTVFTTQDVTGELEAIAAAVNALPQPTPLSRNQGNCSGGALRTTVTGQVRLPRWQAGTYPYLSNGGDIVVVDGVAVQQGHSDVLLSMTFPCGPAPAGGWPILVFMSGTGGGANSANISQLGGNNPSNPLPYVVVSVAPLYSGDRFIPGLPLPFSEPEFLF